METKTNNKLVSVVIPCRNEVKFIKNTVHAILASDYPELEVLVVDGMSDDGTREVLAQLTSADPRVRCIDNPKKLTPYAFNLGVKNAKGGFVQIVGSRNTLSKEYISKLTHQLAEDPLVGCVGGNYQHIHDSKSGRWISLAMESRFGMGFGNYRTMSEDRFVDTVGVPLYRSTIFNDIGYFDEQLTRNQDDDFNFRLVQKGHKIKYIHSAQVTYLVRGSLKKAFKQFSQYGYFKVFVNRKHGAVTSLRQLIPPAFVAFLLTVMPLAIFFPFFRGLFAAVMTLYVFLGLFTVGKNLSLMDRFAILGTCFVLHIGYGFGYWNGIWDFLIRNRQPRNEFQQQTT